MFCPFLRHFAAAFIASGKACTTPWSVMATALCPQDAARATKSAASETPSIADILVCMCSSTRFSEALSCLTNLATTAMDFGRRMLFFAYSS